MIFLIVVTNGYVLVTFIGASAKNHDFCSPLTYRSNQDGSNNVIIFVYNLNENVQVYLKNI